MKRNALTFAIAILYLTACQSNPLAYHATQVNKSSSADHAITAVDSYGFVDLEGAKISAIIVEYNTPVLAASINNKSFEINDYTKQLIAKQGWDKAIARDGDNSKGNEGEIRNIYVNDKPEPSKTGGKASGKYVIIEVNSDYLLNGQNLVYTTSMMASTKQITSIKAVNGETITPNTKVMQNYTTSQKYDDWRKQTVDVIETNPANIILPQFNQDSGWTIHSLDNQPFKATHAYSEYTGKYSDFEMPYSIYVPSPEVLARYKGKIPLVLHMEHAGGNGIDPMLALTSSKAAVKLSDPAWQKEHPAIIIVPQIEDKRRSTDDNVATSEANTAMWQLVDATLQKYKGYIDENRIYGTGQSMGGMLLMNMATQRDNFFAGFAIVGSQWSNSYNKPFQHNGSPARTPENDKVSFNGFGLDKANYQNWYYMISDDNILVHTAKGDLMSTGLWQTTADYFKMAGVTIPKVEFDPFLPLNEQNQIDKKLTEHETQSAGSGINWGMFSRGSHMSTWQYGYQLDYPFEWLFAQTRQSEMVRPKVKQLKNNWLGRNTQGKIRPNSGTTWLNSAQYTPQGESKIYSEGWTPVSVTQKLIDALSNTITTKDKTAITQARQAYNSLSVEEKRKIQNVSKLEQAEQAL